METLLILVTRYFGFALIPLLVGGLVVLHTRLRNARTLSMLVPGLAGAIWLFVSDPLVNYFMPSPSLNGDAAALAHIGAVQLAHSLVAAAIALWFAASFLLATLSCPKLGRDAV